MGDHRGDLAEKVSAYNADVTREREMVKARNEMVKKRPTPAWGGSVDGKSSGGAGRDSNEVLVLCECRVGKDLVRYLGRG